MAVLQVLNVELVCVAPQQDYVNHVAETVLWIPERPVFPVLLMPDVQALSVAIH